MWTRSGHVRHSVHCARHVFPGATRQIGARNASRTAVVLDIDGVVTRGATAVPGAAEALRRLRQQQIPFVFMTNGGGVTEKKKAEELCSLLGVDGIDADRMLLSHTPFRPLAERFREKRVLLVGSKDTAEVAESYGFDVGNMAVTSSQIVKALPEIYPWPVTHCTLPPVDVNAADAPPIEAVLIFYWPSDWAMELQVVSDVLAGGRPLGVGTTGTNGTGVQCAELWSSNPDFLWQAGYPVPRFGTGAFVECLQALWKPFGRSPLEVQECGKPYAVQFQAARKLLSQLAQHDDFERIYMIGDNPAADVRGANSAGDPWRSILVCTGVYQGGVGSNDKEDPAWRVEEHLPDAVESILRMSG
ncbi:unnamed protein product [Cladocopium goreaui]|uniref:CDP-alcohol phosphatidyltransferase class-I family protein C22A12.08c n=1 Tax=Cladocopium goreaui TaxID=2562237 RepID=A0A9P1CR98_9DINO|nr:unnamed protein product [Cladocopium goreaui]